MAAPHICPNGTCSHRCCSNAQLSGSPNQRPELSNPISGLSSALEMTNRRRHTEQPLRTQYAVRLEETEGLCQMCCLQLTVISSDSAVGRTLPSASAHRSPKDRPMPSPLLEACAGRLARGPFSRAAISTGTTTVPWGRITWPSGDGSFEPLWRCGDGVGVLSQKSGSAPWRHPFLEVKVFP